MCCRSASDDSTARLRLPPGEHCVRRGSQRPSAPAPTAHGSNTGERMIASDIAKPWRSERPERVGAGTEVHDVVGVGCGPANLALGICLEEEAEAPGGHDLRRVFLEAKPHAVWHPGMLLEDSLIQIS